MAPMEEDADIWDKNHQYSIITLTGEEIVDDYKEKYVLCVLSWNGLISMEISLLNVQICHEEKRKIIKTNLYFWGWKLMIAKYIYI